MTPQQANELDSDTLRELAKEVGFDWHKYWQDDESNLLETFANLVLARRAPAPTEPAVDRDAVAAIKTDYAGDPNFRSAYLQGFYAAKAAVLRLFATPASPAVPDYDIEMLTLRGLAADLVHLTEFSIEWRAPILEGDRATAISTIAAIKRILKRDPAPQLPQASQPTSAEGGK